MCGAVSVENRLRRNFRVGREIVCLCGAKRISKKPERCGTRQGQAAHGDVGVNTSVCIKRSGKCTYEYKIFHYNVFFFILFF